MPEKILVVDDDLDTLRLVGVMLEKQGYLIAAASNGRQALVQAKSEKPDLILLDVMMPDLSGLEVARQLRADPDTENILIIMFTAKTQLTDKLEGFDAGVDDYVTKPIQPRELVAHVKAVLNRTRRARGAAGKLEHRERGHLVGMLAAKGGLGVSSLATNLGVALADENQDVIVADYRPGCGTIGLSLGIKKTTGLSYLLELRPEQIDYQLVEAELVEHPSQVRFLLSSPFPRDVQYAGAVETFSAITTHLACLASYVIIDLGPTLSPVAAATVGECDQVIVVVEPVPQTILQTKALLRDLVENGVSENAIDIVLNNRVRSGAQLSLSQVQEQLERSVDVIFTPMPDISFQAAAQNTPLLMLQPEGIIAQQFQSLAQKVFARGR